MQHARLENAVAQKSSLVGKQKEKGRPGKMEASLSNLLPVGQIDHELGDLWTWVFVIIFVYLVVTQNVSIDCRFHIEKPAGQ